LEDNLIEQDSSLATDRIWKKD